MCILNDTLSIAKRGDRKNVEVVMWEHHHEMNTRSHCHGNALPFYYNTDSSHLSTKVQIGSRIHKHK